MYKISSRDDILKTIATVAQDLDRDPYLSKTRLTLLLSNFSTFISLAPNYKNTFLPKRWLPFTTLHQFFERRMALHKQLMFKGHF